MGIATYLTMTVEVHRRSAGAINEFGEAADTWASVASLSAVIQPANGKFKREDGGIMKTSSHTLYCLTGANIKEGDKVKYADEFYDVLFVADAAGRAHHNEVELLKLT